MKGARYLNDVDRFGGKSDPYVGGKNITFDKVTSVSFSHFLDSLVIFPEKI